MSRRPAPLGLRHHATSAPQRGGHGRLLTGPEPCPWHDRRRYSYRRSLATMAGILVGSWAIVALLAWLIRSLVAS